MSAEIKFILNNNPISTNEHAGTVLLDFIRNSKRLTGTKEGCKEGDCGACTVIIGELIDGELEYRSINSCLCPISNVNGKHVVTIEGINLDQLNIIQKEFHDEAASQCGFCTPGFIISAATYLINNKNPEINSFVNAIGGNICRCTGYISIRRSLENIINELRSGKKNKSHLEKLIQMNVIPPYFRDIKTKIIQLKEGKKLPKNKGTIIIGGGTDLFVQIPDDILDKEVSSSINKMKSEIIERDGKIWISGTTSFEDLNSSPVINKHLQNINKYMKLIASLPIRNSATIAGNIINASPIGDVTIIMLALNARLMLRSGKQLRRVKLSEFYLGYKELDLRHNEFLEWIEIDAPARKSKFNFEKVSKRTHLDIASVNSAMSIEYSGGIISQAIISAGGVAPVPLVLKETGSFLTGNEINAEIVSRAIELALREISPISDIRGSKEYKSLLMAQMIKSHFIELFPENIPVEELL